MNTIKLQIPSSNARSIVFCVCKLLVVVSAITSLAASCEEKEYSVPFVGPSAGDTAAGGGKAQHLSLTVTPWHTAVLPPDQTEGAVFQLSAFVENGFGQPMPDGTRVIWSASIGTLSAPSSTTLDGETNVTLTFPAGYEGCSWIGARSGDAEAHEVACSVTPVLILSAEDNSIGATESTVITATALTNGEPDVGIQVSFEITLGREYAVLSASSALTDSSGRASVIFRGENTSSPPTVQMVEVTASTYDGRKEIINIEVDKF